MNDNGLMLPLEVQREPLTDWGIVFKSDIFILKEILVAMRLLLYYRTRIIIVGWRFCVNVFLPPYI